MRQKTSLGCAVFIILVILLLWGREAFLYYNWGGTDNSSISNRKKTTQTLIPAQLSPRTTEPPELDTIIDNGTMITDLKISKVKSRHRRAVPQLEFRLNSDTDISSTTGESGIVEQGIDGGGGRGDEKDCNDKPPPGQPPANPGLPPCPPTPPTTEEPTPSVDYKGTKQIGEICYTNIKINKIQQSGLSKYPGVDGLDAKRKELDENACDLSKGLECIGHGEDFKPICACHSSLGPKSLQINGKCFIPVGKGVGSDCMVDGIPLPGGDTRDPKEFNMVYHWCVPNSECQTGSGFTGKRCVCKKSSTQENDGTCSQSTRLRWTIGILSVTGMVLLLVIIRRHFQM